MNIIQTSNTAYRNTYYIHLHFIVYMFQANIIPTFVYLKQADIIKLKTAVNCYAEPSPKTLKHRQNTETQTKHRQNTGENENMDKIVNCCLHFPRNPEQVVYSAHTLKVKEVKSITDKHSQKYDNAIPGHVILCLRRKWALFRTVNKEHVRNGVCFKVYKCK